VALLGTCLTRTAVRGLASIDSHSSTTMRLAACSTRSAPPNSSSAYGDIVVASLAYTCSPQTCSVFNPQLQPAQVSPASHLVFMS
jgi:hypothetical protein